MTFAVLYLIGQLTLEATPVTAQDEGTILIVLTSEGTRAMMEGLDLSQNQVAILPKACSDLDQVKLKAQLISFYLRRRVEKSLRALEDKPVKESGVNEVVHMPVSTVQCLAEVTEKNLAFRIRHEEFSLAYFQKLSDALLAYMAVNQKWQSSPLYQEGRRVFDSLDERFTSAQK